ncbi:MAG: hypothetical protein R3C03_05445 [Pirellulaceae bacterium]
MEFQRDNAEVFFERGRFGGENKPGRFYQAIKPTEEYIENNYYHVESDGDHSYLVALNAFWIDWATRQTDAPFVSEHFALANGELNEILLALAVLDLPLESQSSDFKFDERTLDITPQHVAIVFHQQIDDAKPQDQNATVMISENFFREDDRFRMQDNVQYDKFVEGQFRTHVVYGGRVVATNPTSTPQLIELLLQIPEGAFAVNGSPETTSTQFTLAAYESRSYEYFFYFAKPGEFSHFAAHAATGDQILAAAQIRKFSVTDEPTPEDKSSWKHISQNGTDDEVIQFLNDNNLNEIELSQIAFRVKNKAFYDRAIALLRSRQSFDPTLWSYSLEHRDVPAINEFLQMTSNIVSNVGGHLESTLLTVDAVDRQWQEHHEFWPLINHRAHQVKKQREILNNRIHEVYHELLGRLSHQKSLDTDDQMAVVYYLLLQDRIAEAIERFDLVKRDQTSSKLQFDYLDAYLHMYREQPDAANEIASRYIAHPVPRWRNRFAEITEQVKEINGESASLVDRENDSARQAEMAAQAPNFEMEIKDGKIELTYRNLKSVDMNIFLMDAELLFSSNPFDAVNQNAFSMIRPNSSQQIELPANQTRMQIELPKDFHNKNLIVEIRGGEQAKSAPVYANSLDVQIVESFGQIRVTQREGSKPLSKTYVKVYARNNDGSTMFYKDGYTDLRGIFDYVTQSNVSMDRVVEFSLFIQHDEHGTLIRQAMPPQR